MNSDNPIVAASLARFSAGEISRVELGALVGEPISFGDTLALLLEHKLPLPRYGRDYNPRGIEMVRQLAERAGRG
jgi:hypothetical protein